MPKVIWEEGRVAPKVSPGRFDNDGESAAGRRRVYYTLYAILKLNILSISQQIKRSSPTLSNGNDIKLSQTRYWLRPPGAKTGCRVSGSFFPKVPLPVWVYRPIRAPSICVVPWSHASLPPNSISAARSFCRAHGCAQ